MWRSFGAIARAALAKDEPSNGKIHPCRTELNRRPSASGFAISSWPLSRFFSFGGCCAYTSSDANRAPPLWPCKYLLLKQIIECGASVVRGPGGLHNRVLHRGSRRWRCISRDSHTRREQLADIGCVLWRNSNRDGLKALESGRWLEVTALLAAVQGGAALRAIRFEIRARRKHRRAIEAAGSGHALHEAGQSRTGDIDWRTRALRARTIFPVLAPFRVHVAFLLILAVAFHTGRTLLAVQFTPT